VPQARCSCLPRTKLSQVQAAGLISPLSPPLCASILLPSCRPAGRSAASAMSTFVLVSTIPLHLPHSYRTAPTSSLPATCQLPATASIAACEVELMLLHCIIPSIISFTSVFCHLHPASVFSTRHSAPANLPVSFLTSACPLHAASCQRCPYLRHRQHAFSFLPDTSSSCMSIQLNEPPGSLLPDISTSHAFGTNPYNTLPL
jgi:hypothetical protein